MSENARTELHGSAPAAVEVSLKMGPDFKIAGDWAAQYRPSLASSDDSCELLFLTPVRAWLCLRSPERVVFSPSHLRCSCSGAPPTRCGLRAAGATRGVLVRLPACNGVARRAHPPAVVHRVAMPARLSPALRHSQPPRVASSARRIRCVPVGLSLCRVDDRASPAHRTTSESETLRSSLRLRLGHARL